MAEYIDRKHLDFLNDFRIDGGKYAGLRLDDVFDELKTTDVIERSKLIEMQNSVKELEKAHVKTLREIEERAMVFERENRELRSKIDKAIEELQHIKVYEHTATARLVSLPEVLDVLKKNIGE